MKSKDKSASPFSAVRVKFKKIFVSFLRVILKISDTFSRKKSKEEDPGYSDPLSMSADVKKGKNKESDLTFRTRRPMSVDDFKENKQYKRKHREVKYKREQEEARKEKIKKFKRYAVRSVGALLALCIFVFSAERFYSGIRHRDIEDSAKRFIEGTDKGKGYPYAINGSEVIDMQAIGSNIAVLTHDNFLILNSTAKEVVRYIHGYSEPCVYIYGSRALIYDKATGKFCILNSSEVLLQGDTKSRIYSAYMAKDGSTAFSVRHSSSESELLIYNPSGEKIYSYKTNNEKVFDCAIAPNSKGAAILLIGSKNAEIYSKILIADFKKEDKACEFVYDDTALFDIMYPSRNKVVAVGTNLKTVITKKKERKDDYKYLNSDVLFYDKASNGRNLLVLQNSDNASQKVVEFDSNSKKKFEVDYKEKIRAVTCNNRHAGLLLENSAVLLNSKGEVYKEFKAGKNGKKIVNIGNDVYILYSSNIAKSS